MKKVEKEVIITYKIGFGHDYAGDLDDLLLRKLSIGSKYHHVFIGTPLEENGAAKYEPGQILRGTVKVRHWLRKITVAYEAKRSTFDEFGRPFWEYIKFSY